MDFASSGSGVGFRSGSTFFTWCASARARMEMSLDFERCRDVRNWREVRNLVEIR